MEPEPATLDLDEEPTEYERRPILLPIRQFLVHGKVVLHLFIGLLFFVGFLLQLIGIGVATDKCDSYDISDYYGHYAKCSDVFRGFWWAIFLQFAICIGIGIAILLNVLQNLRAAILCFLTLSTLQMMERTEESLDLRHAGANNAIKVATAGFILSIVGNVFVIFIVAVKKTLRPVIPTFKVDVTYP